MFKRDKSAPQPNPISADLRRIMEQSRKYMLLQISAFERTSLVQVPFYGRNEDVMIAAYAWGLLDGHQQVWGANLNSAETERQCETLAMMALEVSRALFGAKRHERVIERLPLLTLGCWPSGLNLDDKVRAAVEVGGTDGMACAKGQESRWAMGGLHPIRVRHFRPPWWFAQQSCAAPRAG